MAPNTRGELQSSSSAVQLDAQASNHIPEGLGKLSLSASSCRSQFSKCFTKALKEPWELFLVISDDHSILNFFLPLK